ncbi:hypothetical protein ACN20G_16610 [Streptomyces sp. BI20]|uniref:hypothetical protein n=1 Tax=Streptomyces sp. BI20 TaxID=3403460 RepID=UPI003C794D86
MNNRILSALVVGTCAGHIATMWAQTDLPTAVLAAALAGAAEWSLSPLWAGDRTTVHTCPDPTCPVRIRTTGVARAEARELAVLATDHTRHGRTGR